MLKYSIVFQCIFQLIFAFDQEASWLKVATQVLLQALSFEELDGLIGSLDLQDFQATFAGIDIAEVLHTNRVKQVSGTEVAPLAQVADAELVSWVDHVGSAFED